MTAFEVRKAFLDYFKEQHHHEMHSSALPIDDPTLLFTVAGMVPLKKFYTGEELSPYSRMVSSQRCLRTNDIENVGKTPRHHTFFEMLGNFSLGDYFKEETIFFGFDFLTKKLSVSPDSLWASVYPEDHEAKKIWAKYLPEKRIITSKENFWQMAATGPSGFDSEIYFDRGSSVGCQKANCNPTCECGRFLELWNLVFMEFNLLQSGERAWLPKKNIDTGMGLERVLSVVNGYANNYETDLFKDIIKLIEKKTGKKQSTDTKRFHMISDHIRAIVFLIADGVFPENTKHGYVLRRLLRRAKLAGYQLGIRELFLSDLAEVEIKIMQGHYTYLVPLENKIKMIIGKEEIQFQSTLEDGFKVFHQELEKTNTVFDGKVAFKLHDTFGFPIELTREMLEEKNITLEEAVFQNLIQEQKTRAKKESFFESTLEETDFWKTIKDEVGPTKFLGYDQESSQSTVLAILQDKTSLQEANQPGQHYTIILDQTPFFPEKGGPIGDQGTLQQGEFLFEVENTLTPIQGLILHYGKLISDSIQVKQPLKAIVSTAFRRSIQRAHTATHLLHAALKNVLGDYINQAGSLVMNDSLRFDFNALEPMTQEQISQVEKLINEDIAKGKFICVEQMPFEKAIQEGATALFKEKYGEHVRVVSIDDVSKELCGGIHARNTNELRLFRIVKETSIGTNLRRIEAMVGEKAIESFQQAAHDIKTISMLSNKPTISPVEAVKQILEEKNSLELELKNWKNAWMKSYLELMKVKVEKKGEISILIDTFTLPSIEETKSLADLVREALIKPNLMLFYLKKEQEMNAVIASSGEINCRELFTQIKESFPDIRGGGNPKLVQFGNFSSDSIQAITDYVKKMV
ncbi:alanine--tRNA ligase [bacterium]|nr:alanine--tRNA ligase [bacterium]